MTVRACRAAALAALLVLAPTAGAIDPEAPAKAFIVEHTYWVKPGRTLQFLKLFKRIEMPKLEALMGSGKIRGYRIAQPQLSSGQDQWDVRVTIQWRDVADAFEAAPLDLDRRKLDANGKLDDQLLLELVSDHSETVIRETTAGNPDG